MYIVYYIYKWGIWISVTVTCRKAREPLNYKLILTPPLPLSIMYDNNIKDLDVKEFQVCICTLTEELFMIHSDNFHIAMRGA